MKKQRKKRLMNRSRESEVNWMENKIKGDTAAAWQSMESSGIIELSREMDREVWKGSMVACWATLVG